MIQGSYMEAWNYCIMYIETNSTKNEYPIKAINYKKNETTFETPIDTIEMKNCGIQLFKSVMIDETDKKLIKAFNRLSIVNGGNGVKEMF